MSSAVRRLAFLALVGALSLAGPRPASAGPGDAASDSLYLIGEFVDPVCIFQHGMLGAAQKQCALMPGRVEQGMYFYDLRGRRLYTVVGQTHWQDARQGFLDALGDTVAIRAKVWRFADSRALVVTQVWPWREQPPARYRAWPIHWEWTVLLGVALWALAWTLVMTRVRRSLAIPWERADTGRAVMFGLGLVTVVGSLDGPLHDLSDLYLFSTHMVQHLLLAQVFPLLFLAGVPPWAWRWALDRRHLRDVWTALTAVPIGFILYTVVFSMWHVPALYDFMMRRHDFHVVMHLMVMATAVLMWWPVLGGAGVTRALSPPARMLYLFVLGIPMMGVAALITFAGRPLVTWYALAPRYLGLSAVDDQRLGGLIMWVPGSLFFWVVMSIVFFQWSARESRPDGSPVVIPAVPALAPGVSRKGVTT